MSITIYQRMCTSSCGFHGKFHMASQMCFPIWNWVHAEKTKPLNPASFTVLPNCPSSSQGANKKPYSWRLAQRPDWNANHSRSTGVDDRISDRCPSLPPCWLILLVADPGLRCVLLPGNISWPNPCSLSLITLALFLLGENKTSPDQPFLTDLSTRAS